MLVFKRFVRNRLAIVGVCCIGFMFLFSFLGGFLMPYGEAQVFTTYTEMLNDYAGVSRNTEFRYTLKDGKDFPLVARSQLVLARNNGETTFSSQGVDYSFTEVSENCLEVSAMQRVAEANSFGGSVVISGVDGFTVSAAFESAFTEAIESGADRFELDGVEYIVSGDKRVSGAYSSEPVALASYNVFDFASSSSTNNFDFQIAAETAAGEFDGEGSFEFGGETYMMSPDPDDDEVINITLGGELYAQMSDYIIQPIESDVFISLDMRRLIKECIADGVTTFTWEEDGVESEYSIVRSNDRWTIKRVQDTLVVDKYQFPSAEHPLGTDGNGMDLLTRIMYGGRISLMIGFIVVFIELLLGVILGGIAGYFGRWVDNLIMRIVDVFYCIPATPLLIILGSVMNGMRIDPQLRMIYLMLILGFLGWPSIARLVRGQILSLREQEFMVAAEATGLSVRRRIFRHLIPNVIPQLIVNATMSLGSVILTEATLSFLGIGVKYPFASWGNIINDVSDVYVMTNYLFVWIPAGFCILITVLGFNFIGDGLRDAFDPKMKR